MNQRLAVVCLWCVVAVSVARAEDGAFRPPATPLVSHTPYFSVWSPGNRLADEDTIHWTGHAQPLIGLVRIDGKVFRVMGKQPADLPALEQTGFELTPTRSTYRFGNAAVSVNLSFVSPVLNDDLELLARPVTYVLWETESRDGKPHTIEVALIADGALAVNRDTQAVSSNAETVDGMACVRMGTPDQPVVGSKGDDHRIDWGYAYVATANTNALTGTGASAGMIERFKADGNLPGAVASGPTRVDEGRPSIGVAVSLSSTTKASATHLLAYDEVGSILYFGETLKPYWKRNGATMADALKSAAKEQAAILERCAAFDKELTADATRIGGPDYAKLCAMAYRQTVAADGLAADAKGAPLFFPKENHSNGCISTVDVLYPEIPQLLLFSPTLAKAILVPPADYSASAKWKYPYAPHDLGQYPHATGQVYGMRGKDANRMPVEECGNMLLSFAAVAQVEGNAKFCEKWWPQLTSWANYLEATGFDPENQLCTDDFAGHLAHNANLSVKSIVALAAYGKLCGMRGDKAGEAKYTALAKDFAKKWMQAADDGAKYRLAFDRPGSWSQKYNLVWDRVLGLNVFPPEVAEKEMAWYKQSANAFGLPLDSRKTYTKSDWTLWTATLRGARKDDVELFSARLLKAFNEMPQRLPMTDWLETTSAKKVGFTGRSVVGGYFMPFLADAALWSKYAARDKGNPKDHIWAPMPVPPEVTVLMDLSATRRDEWRYTTAKPAAEWAQPKFDDGGWKLGKAGFGTAGTPGADIGSVWKTPDLWLRRTFTLPANATGPILPYVIHDEDVEIYIDGVLAGRMAGFITEPAALEHISPEAQVLLKPGATVHVALHVRNTIGGQYVDFGFATIKKGK